MKSDKAVVFDYIQQIEDGKDIPLFPFLKKHRIHPDTYSDYRKEWDKQKIQKKDLVKEELKEDLDYNSTEYIIKRLKAIDDALIDSATGGNAQSQKIIRQMLGQLVEKTVEVKVTIDAAELAREEREAERELRAFREKEMGKKGKTKVQEGLALLPGSIREDT